MQHFYDGQIRRYITQMIRLMSNFSYADGKGVLRQIPVMYGDITRQVGHIIRDNSENKIPSAPRMSVYVTGLEMDRTRTADATYTGKIHLREREHNSTDGYLNTEGKNYTVERLMPTPYIMKMNADIWSTNTEQKLQIMEQILMLFNPSLEIQTTDNYVDWTSLSVVDLEGITFSTRSIPMGTESEIDVAQLQFSTPIYISPPAKVKKLGVITNVVMSIFDESRGTIDLGDSMPELKQYNDSYTEGTKGGDTSTAGKDGMGITTRADAGSVQSVTYQNYDAIVMNNIVQLGKNGIAGETPWTLVLDSHPGTYRAGLSKIYLDRIDQGSPVVGTFALNTLDETQIIVNWDMDTVPSNTILIGPGGPKGTINAIIDPQKTNPTSIKVAGNRILLLNAINDSENVGQTVGETPYTYQYDGPDAWKNADGTDFVADENDIIEWDGTKWNMVFDASTDDGSTITYTTNLNTGVQYKWNGIDWTLFFEGEYRNGTWRLGL